MDLIPEWKGGLLNLAGKAMLTQATLLAMPVHVPIAVCLSAWAIEAIDGCRRDFLWAGAESVPGGKCKVMQEVVCRPKELEGLGIIDLHRFGLALRLCWEWHQWSDPPRCWVGLWNKPEKVVQALFFAAMEVQVVDGKCSSWFLLDISVVQSGMRSTTVHG